MWAKELQFVAMKVLSKRSSACSVERLYLVALRDCVVQAARARLGPARAVDLAKAGSNLRLKRKLLNLDYEVEMRTQPRRPSAASRAIREDFQMAVGFLFLVLHKESEAFFKVSFLDYQE